MTQPLTGGQSDGVCNDLTKCTVRAARHCWGSCCWRRLAARAQTDQQVVVDRARRTIDDLRHDKAFGNARQLMHQARAVLIVPRLFKGGFIVGGEGGTGVLLARGSGNTWSDPAFFAHRLGVVRPAGRTGAVRDGAVGDDAEGAECAAA